MGGLVVGEFRKIAKGFYLEGLSYDFERDVIWHSAPLEGGICAVNTDGLPRGSFNLDRRWTGGILFGTCDVAMIATARDTRPPAVYRLTQDRNVISLDDAIHFSNGLACDALRRRFYCGDSFRTSWGWDVRVDLTLANKRIVLDRNDCDGMTPPGATTQIRPTCTEADRTSTGVAVEPADFDLKQRS